MLSHFLDFVNQYLQANPKIGEIFAFCIAFAESLPLLGTIIPGSITMTVIGILVGRNLLPFGSTLFWASCGALAGDAIGFWLGLYYNVGIREIWPFRKYPQWLILGENFFKAHGGKSIIIGRFVGPARSTVPLIAGLLKMKWSQFIIAAIPSAFLWAFTYLVPGYLVGAISLEIPKRTATGFIVFGLLTILTIWLTFWLIQRFFTFLVDFIHSIVYGGWHFLKRSPIGSHVLSFITNRKNPEDYHQLTLFFLAFLSFLFFLWIGWDVIHHNGITSLNNPIYHLFISFRVHSWAVFFSLFTILGEQWTILSITLIITIGLLYNRQPRAAVYLIALIILSGLCIGALKTLIESPRPSMIIGKVPGFSFPSGHTTFALTLFGFCSYLAAQHLEKQSRWICYFLASILIVMVALSRLYLGAHWFTDVFGGFFLGTALLLTAIMFYRRYPEQGLKNSPLWWILISAGILLPWTAQTIRTLPNTLATYELSWPTEIIPLSYWWEKPLAYGDLYRRNRFGTRVQPFNVQFVGSLAILKDILSKDGWQPIIYPNPDGTTTVHRLTSLNPDNPIRFLPLLYRNAPPIFMMIKTNQSTREMVVLRFWKSGVSFSDNPYPLWIGSLQYRPLTGKFIQLNEQQPVTYEDYNLAMVTKVLPSDFYEWKVIKVSTKKLPKTIRQRQWAGEILIVEQIDSSSG